MSRNGDILDRVSLSTVNACYIRLVRSRERTSPAGMSAKFVTIALVSEDRQIFTLNATHVAFSGRRSY